MDKVRTNISRYRGRLPIGQLRRPRVLIVLRQYYKIWIFMRPHHIWEEIGGERRRWRRKSSDNILVLNVKYLEKYKSLWNAIKNHSAFTCLNCICTWTASIRIELASIIACSCTCSIFCDQNLLFVGYTPKQISNQIIDFVPNFR